MGEAIWQMLPLAVGVAISPMPIVAMVLMLMTPNARSNGLVFLLGWMGGVLAAGVIATLVLGLIGPSDDSASSDTTSWVKLVLGVLLLVLALREWRARPAPGTEAPTPKWMSALDGLDGARAGGLAFALSAFNPKNLAFIIGAAAALAALSAPVGDEVIAWVVFTLIATIGVAAPMAVYLLKGDSAASTLEHLRAWMVAHNTAIMAVLLLVIGAKLIGDAIVGLGG